MGINILIYIWNSLFHFKSSDYYELDYICDNDSNSIIDFDDEYSELSNLFSKKILKKY